MDPVFDWDDFLEVRAHLIKRWVQECRSFEQIAETLSMDAVQVEDISTVELDELLIPGHRLIDRLAR